MIAVITGNFNGTAQTGTFAIGMDTMCRPLPFGGNWTQVRLGMRISSASSAFGAMLQNAGASNPFFFGLDSSLSDYPYAGTLGTVATGQRTLGLVINNPNDTLIAAAPSYTYDGTANGNRIVDSHASTVDFQQSLATPVRISNSVTFASAIILELTKGYSGVSVSVLALTGLPASLTQATFNSAMSAASIGIAQTVLGANYGIQSATVTGATARDSFGRLDRLCIHADNCNSGYRLNPVMNIADVAVNRLY